MGSSFEMDFGEHSFGTSGPGEQLSVTKVNVPFSNFFLYFNQYSKAL